MSLRPVKGRGSRGRRRYSQLKSQRSYKGWEGWNWKAVKKSPIWTREFYKHKKGIGLIILLSLGILFVTDQALKNPNTHGLTGGTSPLDPYTNLWSDALASNDLTGWQQNRASFFNDAVQGVNYIKIVPDANGPGIALSKTPVDLSTIAGKELWFQINFRIDNGMTNNEEFGWYLTRNATLPGVGPDANYNPGNDPNVAIYERLAYQSGGPNILLNLLIQKTANQAINSGDYPGCQGGTGGGVCFALTTQPATIAAGTINFAWDQLNFTGGSPSGTGSQSVIRVGGGGGASYAVKTLPWLQFQATPYYVGFFVAKGTGNDVRWPGVKLADWPNPDCSLDLLEICNYVPNSATLSPQIDTGGFFGPVIKALISIGIFIFNGILSFIAFVTPALQAALVYLESIFVTTLDLIGSAFGFPNLGSDLASIISNIISFFVSYLPTVFLQFPTLFSDFLTNLNVLFPWIPIAVSIALNLSTLFLNSIIFVIKLVTLSFTLISGIFVIVLFAFYFVYTGDDALGGLLAFLEFTQFLAVNIGVGFTFKVLNWGLDIFLFLVGLIPKPIIQVSIAKIPRLPTIESNARFVPPSFDLGELRAGNMFAIWEWFMGFYFLGWYQQVTPALPGSLGALLPATASHLTPITGMLPLLQICLIIISGLTFLVWPMLKMFSLIGLDIGLQDAFGIGPGRKISAGPSGIRIAKGSKHLQGRVQKKIAGRATEKKKIETAGLAFAEAARKNQVEIEGKNARETGERIIREELTKRRKAPLEGGAA